MKILAIGDFHGTFPKKFYKIIDKEKIDVVVSNGDFMPFQYRNLWFKHCYKKDIELWEVIGKEKFKELELRNVRGADNALKALNKFKAPVITVTGNVDKTKWKEARDPKRKKATWKWANQDFILPLINKYENIKCIDFSATRFEELIFVGYPKSSFPGDTKSKNYRIHRRKLELLFSKFKKENKKGKVIFVSHNVPNRTKLDKIWMKAHKKARGKHYGSKLVKKIIKKYHPVLFIGGHIHEGIGKQKLGKTWMVNPGSAHEGKAAIIEIDGGKVKKVKFIR